MCFGIPVDVTAEVFFENKSVVKSYSITTSVFNKET